MSNIAHSAEPSGPTAQSIGRRINPLEYSNVVRSTRMPAPSAGPRSTRSYIPFREDLPVHATSNNSPSATSANSGSDGGKHRRKTRKHRSRKHRTRRHKKQRK